MGSAVSYHQDSTYISNNFVPRDLNSCTMWMPLDDVDKENGTIEYACGSHHWQQSNTDGVSDATFHGSSDDFRLSAILAAEKAGIQVEDIEFRQLNLKAGSLVLHHQDVWHGSAPNSSAHRVRRAVVAHLLRREVTFRSTPHPDYIYGRYKMYGDSSLHETFFPVTFCPQTRRRSESVQHIPEAAVSTPFPLQL